jgi:hypothetical protein
LLAIALATAIFVGCARAPVVTPDEIRAVNDWGMKQGVRPGDVSKTTLPPGLISFGRNATLHIAHLKDGRYCFLLVTTVGYKDNFDGVLWCTLPLKPSEIVPAEKDRASYVSLPGYGIFEELYIRQARSDRMFDVYFDLN